jgi:hypothetical protein
MIGPGNGKADRLNLAGGFISVWSILGIETMAD